MSDQFPPAPPPPPPPPPQQPYQQPQYQQPPQQPQPYQQQPHQPQYGYGQQVPPVKTGMSGGLKALLIIVGIFAGLGVLTVAGLIVVGAVVANEAEEIVNTAASDLDSELDDLEDDSALFDEDEDDSSFESSFDDEEDLASWCADVDEFDALARSSTDGFTEDDLTDKILTMEEMMEEIDATTPADLEDETADILAPFEGVVAAFRAVDFDATQITAEDNAAFQQGLEDALPSVLVVRQACLAEGISAFEKTD